MDTRINSSIKTTRIAVIVGCVALVIAIAIFALFAFSGGGETLTKDEILANIEMLQNEDPGFDLVASYLSAYGIGNFDRAKFKTVEQYFIYTYYKPLPKTADMALEVANRFLDEYYGNIDLGDKVMTTDALLKCYVAATGDKYAFYRTEEEYAEFEEDLSGDGQTVGIGVLVEANYQEGSLKVMTVMQGSPAETAGVKSGDFIIAVDGVLIERDGVDATLAAMRGEVGTSVTVKLLRGDEEITVSATRATINERSVYYSIDSNRIATISILEFNAKTFGEFKAAVDETVLAGALGIIFDLRNNPGGYLESVIDAIDYLAPDGVEICSYTVGQSDITIYKSDDGHYVNLPMVVLCNGGTASAGELFTAALGDYAKNRIMNVKIVGQTTYGKGIMQGSVPLYDGSVITFTMAYYNPPSGKNYDGVGVVPDVVIVSPDSEVQLETAKSELYKLIFGTGSGGSADL